MAECGDDVVFQSSLDINKKTHQVQLTRRHLTWDVASPGKPSRSTNSPSSQPFIGTSEVQSGYLEMSTDYQQKGEYVEL